MGDTRTQSPPCSYEKAVSHVLMTDRPSVRPQLSKRALSMSWGPGPGARAKDPKMTAALGGPVALQEIHNLFWKSQKRGQDQRGTTGS